VTSSNPPALFVLACIELEEHRFESASRLAQRLASVRPGAHEAVVLARLIEERMPRRLSPGQISTALRKR